MTPREILEKYGLAIDVKSIRERILDTYKEHQLENGMYQEQLITAKGYYTMCSLNACKKADIDLLCEIAEKSEENANQLKKIEEFCHKRFHPIDAMHQIKKILKVDDI